MKHLLILLLLGISFTAFSQTEQFQSLIQKTKQSYLDRGYKLVDESSASIQTGEPLVTPLLNFEYNTYYIVLIQVDGCIYCSYEVNYVDENDFLLPLDFEFIMENNLKQALYKFQNDVNKKGKFVIFLESDLPYYVNIFVFKK
ncbi:MAG TPA: hypothetical protein PKN32_02845 [Bacteroidales bacterium]|nr:hypothetical protein [Bacteroidales bacterium]